METNDRIAQWEKMAREAPDDMAFFSLGNAYKDAGRLVEAEDALARALGYNPAMSRAYQLRAQVLMQMGRNDDAAQLLTKGYKVAAEHGDTMPQRAMESLLKQLGRPVPQVHKQEQAVALGPDAIMDRKTGKPGTRLKEAPMRGPVGQFILEHYSQETWRDWIRQGTKVINELRLDFSNPAHQDMYDQAMHEWLGIPPEVVKKP